MKKILALVLACILVFALAACASGKTETAASATSASAAASSSAASASAASTPAASASASSSAAASAAGSSADQPYIIMVNALNGHPVYEQQAEAARKAAEDYGVKLEIIGPSMGTQTVINDYVAAMENAITLAPDAIICEPFDPALFAGVTSAHAAGIPVFCTSNGTDNTDEYISCSGTDNTQYGITAADMIAEASGGEAHLLVVLGNLTTVNQVEQLEGIKKEIADKYPNMEVVDAVADDNDLSKAVSLFQDNFNAYPEIDTVVMLESTGGPGAAQVAKEMGKQVRILDIDAVAETIDNIEAGEEWATLAQNFYKRGYESVRMAYEYLTQDGKVQYSQFMDSGTVLITKDNAATYEDDLWAAVKVKGTSW
jgi:ribose transport system substrate-binding protein